MKFTLFHLMPYSALDLEKASKYPTAWLHTPNSLYNSEHGADLYERYLGELEMGEELGFDGIAVNEHHSTAYGMMPSPIVTASALARRTKKVKIAILGSALPLRNHPLTLAEEHAMIDTISRGRLITGMVRGIGAEYHVWGTNPAFSHERFHEAHDLIIQAWTKPGITSFYGKHYNHEYINLWPRTYQKPHPPIWIPSQGSKETIDWASHPERKYTYLQTFSPINSVQKYLQQYREKAEQYGYQASDSQLGWAVPIYVSDTEKNAHKEAKLHYENFRNKFLKMPIEMLLPPGYSSIESMKGVAKTKEKITGDITLELSLKMGMFICGSSDSVRQQIEHYYKEIKVGHLLPMMQFGTLPKDLTENSMKLFARNVMPELRSINRESTFLKTDINKNVVAAQ